MVEFRFTDRMQRAALIAHGWTRNDNNKWSNANMQTGTSVSKEVAFKTLLRDCNLC